MSFLPNDYEPPKSNSKYTKFEDGTSTKFRILSEAITGTLVWNDKKPYRFKPGAVVDVQPSRADDSPKHFWAMKVWKYEKNQLEILEITQRTIQSPIMEYMNNDEYGDPKGYNITVSRKKEGDRVTYNVVPSPPKETPDEIVTADKETYVNLEALYEGEDPFKKPEGVAAFD